TLDLRGRDPRDPEAPEKALALDELDRDVAHEHRAEDQAKPVAETGGARRHDLESVAEHVAETHPHSGPENRRRDVEEDELPPRDADHARHRWRDGAESGEELRDQQRFAAALDEEVLGPPHARIRFERDATQQTEDTAAPSPSELVPQEIRGK